MKTEKLIGLALLSAGAIMLLMKTAKNKMMDNAGMSNMCGSYSNAGGGGRMVKCTMSNGWTFKTFCEWGTKKSQCCENIFNQAQLGS